MICSKYFVLLKIYFNAKLIPASCPWFPSLVLILAVAMYETPKCREKRHNVQLYNWWHDHWNWQECGRFYVTATYVAEWWILQCLGRLTGDTKTHYDIKKYQWLCLRSLSICELEKHTESADSLMPIYPHMVPDVAHAHIPFNSKRSQNAVKCILYPGERRFFHCTFHFDISKFYT